MPVHVFRRERINTPTGRMLVVTDEQERVRAVDWEDHEARMHALLRRYYGADLAPVRDSAGPSPARRALDAYFAGEWEAVAALSTATGGTEFQRTVWAALRRIPVGSTVSYASLAVAIGRPAAVRAVGLANGANPISIVVPCHRVIGSDRSLTGYGGGLDRKRWLLTHERALCAAEASR